MMTDEPITVSVTRTVSAGREKEIAAWARAGQDLLGDAPGYLGSGWVRSQPASAEWHMLFRFSDAASLAAWQASPERAWWFASAQGLIANETEQRRTGIEGWFDEPASVEVIRDARPRPRDGSRWWQYSSPSIRSVSRRMRSSALCSRPGRYGRARSSPWWS
jgi:uncharacterized protein